MKTKELETFENHFWNEGSSLSRKIYVKYDTLRYDRGGGNETPLLPIGKSKFIMLNVPGSVTVEFLKQDGVDKMIVLQENQPDFICEAYDYVDPSTVDLTQYQGVFYSEELETRYKFAAEDGVLVAKHRRHSDMPNRMIKTDYFTSQARSQLRFVRNESNDIMGLYVSTGRIKDLWFTKE